MFREKETAEASIITRHSKKFKEGKGLIQSEKYPGLTEPDGVELARKTTKDELKPMIDNLPPNAVFAILGASEQVRTKSTSQVYGDTLAKLYKDDEQVIVKTKEMIENYPHAIERLKKDVNDNPDKKIVINFPLFIKQFSTVGKWVDNKGNYLPYTNRLLEMSGDNDDEAVINWVKTDGKIDGINGPKPLEIAQNYEKGFQRLREFCQGQATGRPIVVGGVGHSCDIDVFIAYLTHGKVDLESIQKIMGKDKKMIQETELFYFETHDNKITGRYRGKDYTLDLEKK